MGVTVEQFKNGLVTTTSPVHLQELFMRYVQETYGFQDSKSIHHSLNDGNKRMYVRCSRVIKRNDNETFLDFVISPKRLLTVKESYKETFRCNIQQLRYGCFDFLYSFLLFDDSIRVCKITATEMNGDSKLGFVPRHHSDEDALIVITPSNVKHFLEKYEVAKVSYDKLLKFAIAQPYKGVKL